MAALAPLVQQRHLAPAWRYRADIAVGSVLGWWATYFTWGSGGQNPHLLSIALVLVLLAGVLVRPWERVPLPVVALLTSVGVGAFVVVLLAPTGWQGASEAASYVFASQLGLVVLAWAQDPVRRMAVLGCVLAAAVLEFGRGWVQWMAQGDADQVFVGTFFWHNQTGIFLVMGVAVGLPLLALGAPHVRSAAWLSVPLCGAGVFFTTSRGSQMALVLAALGSTVLVLSFSGPRLVRLARTSLALAGTATLTWLLTGPPFFVERVTAAPGAGSRHEALTQNGVNRLEFWKQAIDVFQHWPITGGGFHSFSAATRAVDPEKTLSSAFAHNSILQLFSDGGLVLALPVIAVLGLTLIVGSQRVRGSIEHGEATQPVALLTLFLLLLHSGMDFDWSYPSLLAAVALVAPVATGHLGMSSPGSGRQLRARRALAGISLLLLGLAVVAGWRGGILLYASIGGAS